MIDEGFEFLRESRRQVTGSRLAYSLKGSQIVVPVPGVAASVLTADS